MKKATKNVLIVVVLLIAAFLYYYITIPAFNIHSIKAAKNPQLKIFCRRSLIIPFFFVILN